MKKHIFLTGEIQIGKTTAIKSFLNTSGLKADGYLTRFTTREQERELMLYRFDTDIGESDGKIAVKMNMPDYELFIDTFDVHGAEIIRASGKHGLIIMDELGVFEERAPNFKAAVKEKLAGDIPILGVIKKRESPFLDALRAYPDIELITVTVENRDDIPELLCQRFCQ